MVVVADAQPPHRQEPDEVLAPVCGMTISPADAVGTLDHPGQTYYFCSDVAMESADVTLVKGDLRGIVRARRLSRATM